jgi:purine-binding chemotaxis protein CheW
MFKLIQNVESNQFLGFILDEEPYCINIMRLQEIIEVPPISKIPNVPGFIEGAIDLRGKIVRVINFRKWLQLPWQFYNQKSRILIVTTKDGIYGYLVDEILGVFTINPKQKYDVPAIYQQESELGYLNSVIYNDDQLFLEINPETVSV